MTPELSKREGKREFLIKKMIVHLKQLGIADPHRFGLCF